MTRWSTFFLLVFALPNSYLHSLLVKLFRVEMRCCFTGQGRPFEAQWYHDLDQVEVEVLPYELNGLKRDKGDGETQSVPVLSTREEVTTRFAPWWVELVEIEISSSCGSGELSMEKKGANRSIANFKIARE